MTEFPRRHVASLTGHNGPVHCVTFSAGSGQYVLTGAGDRTIRLFNPTKQSSSSSSSNNATNVASRTREYGGRGAVDDPQLVQTFSAHGYEVLDLAVAADNSRFASVGGDRQVFLWDVATGQTVRRWAGHGARVNAVTFGGGGGGDNNDAIVVSGSFDATVRLWDARSSSMKPIQMLDDARDSVSSVCVVGGNSGSADIVAGSVDGRVRTYDLRMGSLHTDCVGAPVTSVSVTADGEALLVSSLDSTLRLFDRGSGRCLREYRGLRNESYRIRSCLGLADAVAVSGSEDGSVYAWDIVSGEVLYRQEGLHGSKVATAVAWNGRKKEWASAGSDGEQMLLRIYYNLANKMKERSAYGPRRKIRAYDTDVFRTLQKPQDQTSSDALQPGLSSLYLS